MTVVAMVVSLIVLVIDGSNSMSRSDGLMTLCFDTEDPAHQRIIAWALERGLSLRDRASRETLTSLSSGAVKELRAILEHVDRPS